MTGTTVVLVPGSFTGAWMWTDVATLLECQHIDAVALELPTSGQGSGGADFRADARAVREALDRLEPPVLLCGHSYGGGVITEAAAGPHRAVRHLVYLNAAVPDIGDSIKSLISAAVAEAENVERPDKGLTFREDGLAQLDREQARRVFFSDCSAERADEGLDQLRPANVTGSDQLLTGAAWRDLPATYVRGTRDVLPEAVSAMFFAQGPELIELPVGHCPNWSQPELVATLLAERARILRK